ASTRRRTPCILPCETWRCAIAAGNGAPRAPPARRRDVVGTKQAAGRRQRRAGVSPLAPPPRFPPPVAAPCRGRAAGGGRDGRDESGASSPNGADLRGDVF